MKRCTHTDTCDRAERSFCPHAVEHETRPTCGYPCQLNKEARCQECEGCEKDDRP